MSSKKRSRDASANNSSNSPSRKRHKRNIPDEDEELMVNVMELQNNLSGMFTNIEMTEKMNNLHELITEWNDLMRPNDINDIDVANLEEADFCLMHQITDVAFEALQQSKLALLCSTKCTDFFFEKLRQQKIAKKRQLEKEQQAKQREQMYGDVHSSSHSSSSLCHKNRHKLLSKSSSSSPSSSSSSSSYHHGRLIEMSEPPQSLQHVHKDKESPRRRQSCNSAKSQSERPPLHIINGRRLNLDRFKYQQLVQEWYVDRKNENQVFGAKAGGDGNHNRHSFNVERTKRFLVGGVANDSDLDDDLSDCVHTKTQVNFAVNHTDNDHSVSTRRSLTISKDIWSPIERVNYFREGFQAAIKTEITSSDHVSNIVTTQSHYIVCKIVAVNRSKQECTLIDVANAASKYTRSFSNIMPLPSINIVSLSKRTVFKAGTKVLAVYPATTCFYAATIVKPPKSNQSQQTKYTLRFDDDGDNEKDIESERVMPYVT